MDEKKNTAPQEQEAVKRSISKGAHVIQVIEITTTAGDGTDQNPFRIITEYWSFDGKLLAVSDPEAKG